MALLDILKYPDPRLHKVARPVEVVDARVQALCDDMLQTMYAADGVGLAATQVNVHERVVVADTSEDRKQPLVFINPEITERSEAFSLKEEGCLSVPQTFDKVQRHEWVVVRALGRDGQPFELRAEGLLSVCVQHELDHLEGRVFVEYLSSLKRDRIRTRLIKQLKSKP